MQTSLKGAYAITAAEIARALGGARKSSCDRRYSNYFLCRCPVPSHGKGRGDQNPSLLVREGEYKALFKCFAGCEPREIIIELERLGLVFKGDHKHPEPKAALNKALWLWRLRQPVAGSIAETYLRKVRAYGGPLPATIGFLPARGEHKPALIAAFGLAHEPEPGSLAINDEAVRGIHLTRLNLDGTAKAGTTTDKIMIGRPAGVPIVIAPPNDTLAIGITEGIENGLSVHEATGIGVWAAGSASLMPALVDVMPSYIQEITIVADDDPPGRQSASKLKQRLLARDFAVRIVVAGVRRKPPL